MPLDPVPAHGGTPAVAATRICKTFAESGGAAPVLQDLDLTIAPGSFVTLFGPSGCGKSTLLRIAAGLETPSSGGVRLFGHPPGEAAARKWVSWSPQSPALLPWLSVRDNLALPLRVNRRAERTVDPLRHARDLDQVLADVGLTAFAAARPARLSGGMRQRAALARAFVLGAPLMFMDEPFSALDELTRNALCWQLLDMWDEQRRTVLFVTHSAQEAVLLSDRVLVMHARPGRIAAEIVVDLPRPRTIEQTETPEFAADRKSVV